MCTALGIPKAAQNTPRAQWLQWTICRGPLDEQNNPQGGPRVVQPGMQFPIFFAFFLQFFCRIFLHFFAYGGWRHGGQGEWEGIEGGLASCSQGGNEGAAFGGGIKNRIQNRGAYFSRAKGTVVTGAAGFFWKGLSNGLSQPLAEEGGGHEQLSGEMG